MRGSFGCSIARFSPARYFGAKALGPSGSSRRQRAKKVWLAAVARAHAPWGPPPPSAAAAAARAAAAGLDPKSKEARAAERKRRRAAKEHRRNMAALAPAIGKEIKLLVQAADRQARGKAKVGPADRARGSLAYARSG